MAWQLPEWRGDGTGHRPLVDVPQIRVAMFVDSFPLLSETFIVAQAAALVRAGFDVTLFATRRETSGLSHPDLAATGLLARTRFASDHPLARAAQFVRRPWRLHESLNRLAVRRSEHMPGTTFDVILCHFGPVGARATALRARGGIAGPVWTIFHGYDLSSEMRRGGDGRYTHLFATGDLFVPISAFWRDRLIEMGCPPQRITVQHMGVPCDQIAYRPRAPVTGRPFELLSVCRLTEKKGIAVALRAVAALDRAAPGLDWRYRIVGSGPLGDQLQSLVRTLGLQDRVTLLGPVQSTEIPALLAGADLFLLPSLIAADGDMEGIPVALMEAMASGVPVVSTVHSGIPELISHGHDGLLAAENDVAGLAEHIARLAGDTQLRERLARAARDTVETRFNNSLLNAVLADMIRAQANAARAHRRAA